MTSTGKGIILAALDILVETGALIKRDYVEAKKVIEQVPKDEFPSLSNTQQKIGDRKMQNRLRPKTVKLISQVLKPWVDNGEILPSEMQIIKSNLNSLAQKGELAPLVPPKMLMQREVAELLSLSYSNYKRLEKMGIFTFQRRMIHSAVRYLNTDVFRYMSDNAENKNTIEQQNNTIAE